MGTAGPKIIAGGQPGTDRGALDAALETETPCGGWCPKERRAEDGVIPERYPLSETGGTDYEESTRMNVQGSDATLILHYGSPSTSAEETERFCHAHSKPLLLINAKLTDIETAEQQLFSFLRKYSVHTLHVAGPRRSEEGHAYDYAHRLLVRLLRR